MLCAAFMVAGHAVANDNLSVSTNPTTPISSSVDIALPEDGVTKEAEADSIKSGISVKYYDIFLGYGPKSKVGAVGCGVDIGKYAYFAFLGNIGFGDMNQLAYVVGLGPRYRYVSDSFMAFGSAYVYGGYGQYDYETYNSKGKIETKTERDFAYGMAFDFKLGACLNSNSKGERNYLSIGYLMTAGDFKFKKIGKFGTITLTYTMKL